MKNLKINTGCTLLEIQQTSEKNSSLEEQADQYLAQNPFLVLDVNGINFTSMNIGELINLYNSFKEVWNNKQHTIGLLNLNPHSLEVFKTAKLDQIFPNFNTVEEAFQSFKSS